MSKLIRTVLLLAATILSIAAEAATPTAQQLAKIAPAFQGAIVRDGASTGLLVNALPARATGIAIDGAPLYDAIIYADNPGALAELGIRVGSIVGGFATARLTASDMLSLSALQSVRYIDPGTILYPDNDVSKPDIGASLLHSGFLKGTPYTGKGAIVLVYDTGIDWKHRDFRDPADSTKSRILSIWDQSLTPVAGEAPPQGFTKGVEYTKLQIEAELGASPPNFVRERDVHGHGTHVMGIAAGNGSSLQTRKYVGVAPEADLIVVKGGDNSFSEPDIIDGLTYAKNKATQYYKPIVVNMSLGGQDGMHDGLSPEEVAVDSFVTTPGHVVAIAAGNDGDKPIHISGTIVPGDSVSITLSLPPYTQTPGPLNDILGFNLGFPSGVSVRAKVISPGGITYIRNANSFGTCPDTSDGLIYLVNEPISPSGKRVIDLEVYDNDTIRIPKAGTWTLRLSNATGSSTFDGWLYAKKLGTTQVILNGGNTSKTIAVPGTAKGAITAGSWMTRWSWPSATGVSQNFSSTDHTGNISVFSSVGPTGDNRQKPDLVAPGEGVASSLSSSAPASPSNILPGGVDQQMSGTSMATPQVTGSVALLLAAFPSLTASEVKSLLTGTAMTDGYTGSVPNPTWGNGKLDIFRAMARAVAPASVVTRQALQYDVLNSSVEIGLTGTTKYAVRFSPSISGVLTGFQLSVSPQAVRPVAGSGSIVCEIYTNVPGSINGVPGTRIGNPVQYTFAQLSPYTRNHVDMSGAGISVSAGQDYHLILSLSNPADTLFFSADNGASPAGRSSILSGTQWHNFADPSSPVRPDRNLRLRAVVTATSGLSTVEQLAGQPLEYRLDHNYPNPFNPSTAIRYSIPRQGPVTLQVFDVIGREVATLVQIVQPAGSYEVVWNGTDNSAMPVSTGVYFYRLQAGAFAKTEKMMLLK